MNGDDFEQFGLVEFRGESRGAVGRAWSSRCRRRAGEAAHCATRPPRFPMHASRPAAPQRPRNRSVSTVAVARISGRRHWEGARPGAQRLHERAQREGALDNRAAVTKPGSTAFPSGQHQRAHCPGARCGARKRQRATNGAGSIRRVRVLRNEQTVECRKLELADRCEQAERDRKIERGAFLRTSAGERLTVTRRDGSANPESVIAAVTRFARFLHGAAREADDRPGREVPRRRRPSTITSYASCRGRRRTGWRRACVTNDICRAASRPCTDPFRCEPISSDSCRPSPLLEPLRAAEYIRRTPEPRQIRVPYSLHAFTRSIHPRLHGRVLGWNRVLSRAIPQPRVSRDWRGGRKSVPGPDHKTWDRKGDSNRGRAHRPLRHPRCTRSVAAMAGSGEWVHTRSGLVFGIGGLAGIIALIGEAAR